MLLITFFIVCPPECGERACSPTGTCCSEDCIGSCYHDTNNVEHCNVCRHLDIGDGKYRKCANECKPNEYKLYDRRCVTYEECRNLSQTLTVKLENLNYKFPFVATNGICSKQCPPNMIGSADGSEHKKCELCEGGSCKKICKPATLDSISAIQNYRGCTTIAGSLAIQIRSQGGCESGFFCH